MILWDKSPPSSLTKGFPNKVVFPYCPPKKINLKFCYIMKKISHYINVIQTGPHKFNFFLPGWLKENQLMKVGFY